MARSLMRRQALGAAAFQGEKAVFFQHLVEIDFAADGTEPVVGEGDDLHFGAGGGALQEIGADLVDFVEKPLNSPWNSWLASA